MEYGFNTDLPIEIYFVFLKPYLLKVKFIFQVSKKLWKP